MPPTTPSTGGGEGVTIASGLSGVENGNSDHPTFGGYTSTKTAYEHRFDGTLGVKEVIPADLSSIPGIEISSKQEEKTEKIGAKQEGVDAVIAQKDESLLPGTRDLQKEIITAADQIKKQDQTLETPLSAKSTENTEEQQKMQEAQKAWNELIEAINVDNGTRSVPYRVPFEYAEKKGLIVIKSISDSSNPNSETYLAITLDGPKRIQATSEVKDMVNKWILSPEGDGLKNLNVTPALPEDNFDLISSTIKESQEMATKIEDKRNKIKEIESSRTLAEKLTLQFKPQQPAAPPAPKI